MSGGRKLFLFNGDEFLSSAIRAVHLDGSRSEVGPAALTLLLDGIRTTLWACHPKCAVVVWGNAASARRRAIDSRYKPSYPLTEEKHQRVYASCRSTASELLSKLRFAVVHLPEKEARDTIAYIAAEYPERSVVVSADRVYQQLISHNIALYLPHEKWGSMVTEATFSEIATYSPSQCLIRDAILGGSGVYGIPESLHQFVDVFLSYYQSVRDVGTLKAVLESDDCPPKAKRLAKDLPAIIRNVELFRLMQGEVFTEEDRTEVAEALGSPKVLDESVAGIFAGVKMQAHAKLFDKWVLPFRGLLNTKEGCV